MPRTIEFDKDAVMHGAMGEFRRAGYAGTSIKSLERATGLSSGSLYNSYGGKDQLFTKALSHYNQVVVKKRIENHMQAKDPVEGIRSLFLSLLDEPNGGSFGCLLTNSAIEFGAADSIARSGIQEGMDLLEAAFQTAIDQLLAAAGANSGSALQHKYTAARLLAFYQGILVLIRFGRPRDDLRNLINNEIDQLTGATT